MTQLTNFTKEISQLIETQFPAIYREDGAELVTFLEAYYEFLESDNKYSYKLGRQIFELADIDTSLEDFMYHFKETYLADFPYALTTDKKFLIKHISDYYQTKGSKQSLELLMKLLYNQEIDVYYPGQDILKLSDSEWFKPSYLEITVSPRNASFLDKQIFGTQSGAKAFVESIVRKRVKGKIFDVLLLSSLQGNFKTGERVSDTELLYLAPRVKGSLSAVTLDLGGRNNKVGDIFNVVTSEGVQGKVKVTEIIDATGRVDFEIIKGGWGYTLDSLTDVYVSNQYLFVDNPTKDFITYETLYQPIEKVKVISASDIMNVTPLIGQYLNGRTSSNTVVANGTIVAASNLDANDNPTATITGTALLTLQLETGSFGDIKNITLNSNNIVYPVNETITEESTYNIGFSGLAGNTSFTNGEILKQSVYSSVGTTVTGLTGTLTAGNKYLTVSSVNNIIVGQLLIKTSGTGAFKPLTSIKRIYPANNTIVLNKDPATAGAITFTANTFFVKSNYAFGTVTSSNTSTVIVTNAFGDFNTTSNTIIVGTTSHATALPNTVVVTAIGAKGKVVSKSGNVIGVNVKYGTFDNGNLIRGDKTNGTYTVNSSITSGAEVVYLNGNNNANGVVYLTTDAFANGIVIGQSANSVGLYSANSSFFVANTYSSYIYTDRSTMLTPPRYANGDIIELKVPFTRIGGGHDASFSIVNLDDVEENVTLYTDLIGGTNVAGVPYTEIEISGRNSGYGFVADMEIITPGSGYANGDLIVLHGGGYANGDPVTAASATIITDSAGGLALIDVYLNGSNYYETPVFTLPENGVGADANVSVVMDYGYGFPKSPNAEYNNFIGDVLNTAVADLGSISLLGKINPGAEYTVDPFVQVLNKYVGAMHRYDLVLSINNLVGGTFKIDELITQTVGGVTSVKGRVKAIKTVGGTRKLYLERITYSIAFVDGYPIKGSTTLATANIVDIFEDETALVIGKNAEITGTAISASGVATALAIVDSGFGYINDGPVTLEKADNPFIITGTSITTKQGISEGYWRSTNSHLNSEKKIQDNNYYQEFSYDIMSGLSLNKYKNILKKVFHIAGTKMFGSVAKISSVSSPVIIASKIVSYESIAGLFSTAQGAWYDPADLTTLFQDSAGTVPVTANGNPVGMIRDKSGNGNHATQNVTAKRPTYHTDGTHHWITFDGIDDFLVTPTITPGTNKAQVFTGVKKLSNTGSGLIVEHSNDLNTNPGAFYLFGPVTTGVLPRSYAAASKGTARASAFMAENSIPSPSTNIVSLLSDIGGNNLTLRVDGAVMVQSVADQGTGNYLAYPVYIGKRGGISAPLSGNLYSMILRFGPNLSATEINYTEQYVAVKTGVAL